MTRTPSSAVRTDPGRIRKAKDIRSRTLMLKLDPVGKPYSRLDVVLALANTALFKENFENRECLGPLSRNAESYVTLNDDESKLKLINEVIKGRDTCEQNAVRRIVQLAANMATGNQNVKKGTYASAAGASHGRNGRHGRRIDDEEASRKGLFPIIKPKRSDLIKQVTTALERTRSNIRVERQQQKKATPSNKDYLDEAITYGSVKVFTIRETDNQSRDYHTTPPQGRLVRSSNDRRNNVSNSNQQPPPGKPQLPGPKQRGRQLKSNKEFNRKTFNAKSQPGRKE
ncbi:hypothetical protein LSH36_39g16044 [Paralvinella palmiformis]|uniref:Uncharacterized protein n=1 Tax=Paralvinella palmiformis TaxID=53620 RepID=A0AAD9NDP6_9ANNE|nr:hypothetical protein LSH36_39g16044 [Paralvinella palmiformis]